MMMMMMMMTTKTSTTKSITKSWLGFFGTNQNSDRQQFEDSYLKKRCFNHFWHIIHVSSDTWKTHVDTQTFKAQWLSWVSSGFRGVLISPYPDQEGSKQMFLSEWREFPSVPCLTGGGGRGDLMIARVSMFLKSRASLTCFRACFLPGRAKDLSAHRYIQALYVLPIFHLCISQRPRTIKILFAPYNTDCSI